MEKLLLLCCLALLHSSSACRGFAGKEFAFSLMQNYAPNQADSRFSITIIAQQPTKVKVHVPSLNFLKEEFLQADQSVNVRLPVQIELIGSKKYAKTVLVEATADVMVTSFNYKKNTADSALLYPISKWGTEYYVFTPSNGGENKQYSETKEFSVTNGKQSNRVEINIKGGFWYEGHLYADGQRLVLDFRPYESLQLQSSNDLTGSRVSSQYPVGVLSGNVCNILFANCDHVYEQLLPVSSWGSNFMVAPLSLQNKYDSVFIQASQSTNINIQNGKDKIHRTLTKGQTQEVRFKFPDAVTIKADRGVQVLMVFNGVKLQDGREYDNFLMTILPTEVLCSSYSLVTQSGFDNVALVLAPKVKKHELSIDGVTLTGWAWHDIAGTDFSFSEVALRPEPVRIFSSSGFSFGLYGLGFTMRNSFGSPALFRQPAMKCPANSHYEVNKGVGACVQQVKTLKNLGSNQGSAWRSFAGKEFAFSFLQNYEPNQEDSRFSITIIAQQPTKVKVHVPSLNFLKEEFLQADQSVNVRLPVQIELIGSKKYAKTVLVEATADVMVTSFNYKKNTADSALLYPISKWGTEYYVFTPSNGGENKQYSETKEFSVTNGKQNNRVEINIKGGFWYEGHLYADGQRLVLDFRPYESLQLQSSNDLTGSRVSSQYPVGVLSGNVCNILFSSCDHVYEQLLPVSSWGSNFMVAPLSFQNKYDSVFIQASQSTNINIQNGKDKIHRTLTKGQTQEVRFKFPNAVTIKADHGVQVLMVFNGVKLKDGRLYDNFLMTILPTEVLCSSYSLVTQSGFDNIALILAPKVKKHELSIDGVTLTGVTWHDMPGTDFSFSEVALRPDPVRIFSSSGFSFGLYSLGFTMKTTFGSPALFRQPAMKCPANSHYEVNKGVGACVQQVKTMKNLGSNQGSASRGFAGKEFAFSFMQNYKPNYDDPHFSITIIAKQPTKVKVHVPSLNFLKEEFLRADQSVNVRLPVQIELIGSKKYAKTVLVEATADVMVTSFNYKKITADSALLYPTSKWGTEYYVFTPSGTPGGESKEFSVTNGKQVNRVEINIKGDVKYEGHSYADGQRLVLDLGPYESLQLQSSNDLTGSRISSQYPVGVMSGHTCNWQFAKCDHVYEQLLPVSSWGSNFMVAPLSFQNKYDSVFIQASQSTNVNIQNGKTNTDNTLSKGQSMEVRFKFPDAVTIKADRGVQVLMVFNGAKLQDGRLYDNFLLTILPTEVFCSSYSLVTQSGFENVALIVAPKVKKHELSIDGVTLTGWAWHDIAGTDFSFSEVALRPEPVRIFSSSGFSFGLYGLGFTMMTSFGSPALSRQPAVKPGICWAQGDPHYSTFDGRRFDFMGSCTYLIAKNCEKNTHLPTFEISAQNENRGNTRVSYIGLVTVKIAGYTITTVKSEIGRVRVDNNLWSLPLTLNEGKLQLFQGGRSIFIQTDFGLLVRYDWISLLVVTLPSSFAGKTCGLCGNFNGDPKDDLTTREGTQVAGVPAFGASWKVPGLVKDDRCTDDCVGGCKSCTNQQMKKWEVESSCGLMALVNKGPFSKCHAAVDPVPYMDNCKFDLCMNDGLKYFLCKSLESYAESCQEADVQVEDWRKLAKCPYKCQANSVYQRCGSACPATCSNSNPKCTLPCMETCTCNKGFVLVDGQCQPVANCGCTHEGRYLAPGQSFWADDKCQKRCTCNANSRKVECKAVGCKAGTLCQVLKGIKDCHPISHGKCRATGDPHYVTFDKKKFDFMGTCVYQMVKHSMGTDLVPFEVLVQNDHRGSNVVSYTKLVEVKVYSLSVVISRTYQGVVMVDGELANLPLSLAGNRVSVYKSGRYAVVSTNFGLKVFFDWERALFVSLPSSYMGQVSGLCGNYNGKAEDDLTPKDGKVIVPQAQFGASWQVEKIPGCVDSCQGKCPSCDITQKRRYETGTFCGILTDPKGPFRDCHSKVNPADYFEDCVFDVCSFEGRKNVLCQAITSYSSACQAVGAKVYSWRTSQFCEIKCPANSRYETCAAVCPATCQTNLAALGCDEPCREGCVCEEGFVLSGERCVPVSQCGCVDGDRYYTLNQVFYPNGKCDKECKCTADGEVECKTFACGANEKCQVQKGKRQCQAVGVGICQRSGDLHYRSFDGRVFNLQGTCTYTLSKTNLMKGTRLVAFTVRVENDNQKMSVTKGVSLDVYGFNLVLRNTVSGVLVNGILHYLPLSLNNGAVNVYQKGVHYFIATDFGLLLTYDLNYFLTLTVPGNYKGQTSGLCGNFNDCPKDDFQRPDSGLTKDLNVFTGSWEVKVPGIKCERGCKGHNCMANDKTDKCPDAMSSQGCLPMMDGNAFKQCRAKVDPKVYYDNCVADSCASKGDRKVVCNSMAAYALRCHLAGINVNWRTDHLCPMKCPANSHYEVCSNNCGVACPGLTDVVECPSSCTEGCTCNDGFLFNGQSCVPMAQCGCYENGRTFRPNEAVYGDGCKQSCRCDAVNGLVCKAHSCSADSQCQVNEGVRACFQQVKQQKKLESNQGPASRGFAGKEFAFSFMQNYKPNYDDPHFSITIIAKQPTKVKVHVPSLNFLKEEFLRADQSVNVRLPVQIELIGSKKYAKTVLVEATADVMVTSFNYKKITADSALLYPTSKWGTEYYVFTPSGTPGGESKEFSVTNGKQINRVEINIKGGVMYEGHSYADGQRLVLDLGPYESLQLQSSNDLTGSRISSQYPVGVMSGHTCNWQFAKCDHVYEQLLPVSSWGSNFMVAPLSFQNKYDSVFIQASQSTNVNIQNGKVNTDNTLSKGQSMEVRFKFPDAVTIKADRGVQVLMVFNGAKLQDGRLYDNFLLTILPTEVFCSSYSLVTQSGFENVALILAPKVKKHELSIDGVTLTGWAWHDIAGTDFSFSEVALRPEPVRIFSSSGFSFGLYGLGFTMMTSFGSPALSRQPAVKPGICWAQGDPHYSTFDGRRFDFMGTCTYLIAKNCEKNTHLPTFEISAQNENRGNTRVSYIGLVTVKIAGYTITTVKSEIGRVRVDNNLWSLPLTLNEGKLQLFQGGRSIFIQTDFGLLVRYDWISLLVVTLPSSFTGKTCGLCGNFNGDPKDDLTTREGTQVAGVPAFGASWKVPGLVKDDRCTDDCVGGCKSCTNQQMKKWEVESSCGLMALVNKGPFSKCHAAVDPVPYMDNCKFDLCMNDGLKYFLCKSLESYAESCQEADVQVEDWRKLAKCPYKCQANSVYQRCGSACPATCSNSNPKCTLPCMETCTCNKGFVLVDGQCQPVANCGCTHEGRYLAPGQSFWADDKCQKRCTCNANTRKVECKAVGCKAGTLCQVLKGIKDCHPISHGKCRATGDPHYVTFDKKKFDFMGTCVYQMVKHSMGTDLVPFEVLVQNDHRGSNVVSYTKLVEVKVYSLSIVISRTYQGVVMVDGELANLPLSLAGNRVSVYKSGRYAVVSTNFGLKVFFDWERALFVSLPSSYMGQVSGLCGNYNGKAEDDLTPKDGKVIVPQAQFGASWQVEKIPGCVDSCQGKCPSCDITQKRRYETGTFCGILTDPKGPFRDCHSKVNPADYFEDCVFDVCSFEGRKNVLCQAITSYSSACQAVGAKVYSWRTSQFCEIKCPANSRYETCAAVCPATCQTNLAALGCDEPCREGCVCEEGFVLSGERCVPVSQCGCVDGDRYYTLNQVFYPNGKCDKECKCTADGEVECKTFACGANEKCQVQKGKRQCQAVGVGICQRSGDLHYRSFDGRVFNLQGTCTYTLSKTNLMKGTRLVAFAVRVENDNQKMSVTKGVSLDVYGFNLVLRNTVSGVLVNGILHYLPLSLNNGAVNVYQKGVHYFIATDFGLLLTYDLNYFLTLTVPGNYKGQTSGLCGNFNDNPKDDFQRPDSGLTEDLNVFTGSWEVKVPGVKCERGCKGHNCMANDKTDKCPDAMSSQGCLPMMDGNAFKQCRAKVDPKVYYDNCVADSCASKGDRKVVCNSMAAYALRCHLAGINVNWRTDHLCPMKCPVNSHYEVCSNNCGVACPGLTDVVECPSSCTEGCTCNDGFLFNGQSCVPMAQCGCYENGRTFRPNEAVYGDGCKQSCRCDAVNGLVCKAHSCSADSQCQVNEGVRACFQQVKQQKKLESNQGSASRGFAGKEFAFSFMQNYKPNSDDPHFSITIIAKQPTKVKVHVPSLNFLKEEFLRADQSVNVRLPVQIELIGSKKYAKTVLVEATADVMVTSFNYKKITADSALLYPTSKWGTEYYVFTPSATPASEFKEFSVTNGKQKNRVEINIKGGVMYEGHSYADGQRLVLDLGPYESLQLQSSNDLTGSRISSQYPVGVMSGHTCNWLFAKCDHVYEQLLPVSSWGSNFMVAPLSFQNNYDSVFIQASQSTNVNIQNGKTNTDNTLSKGQSMEVRFKFPDAVTIKADRGVQVLMVFNGAKLQDGRLYDNFLMTILPTEVYCSSYSLVTQSGFENVALIVAPKVKKHELSVDGVTLTGVTWHDIAGTDFSFSEVALRPEPVRIFSSSGFSFGLYGLGFTMMTSFGSPALSRQPAVKPGICWAQGDPHYSTFDGRRFDFMGTCTYLIAKNCEKNTHLPTFEISAQNENRGNTRVSYIGLVTVKIAGYTITTVKSEIGRVRVDNNLWSLPLTLNEGKLQLFQGGRSIFIQTDFGLLVRYDWISLLVVTLPSSFAGKTCGLCGNFNGDPKDDLTTREGTQVAGVPAFGASWKVPGLVKDDRCTDDCVGGCKSCTNQQMKKWEVESSCGLMALVNKGPFSKCHAAVDPVPYMDNCKFDLCMNDGLRYFLCKSLESYSESCQEADVQVEDWRKLAKCPFKCQANSVYQRCGSACPATCSNSNPKCTLPCMETCTCNKGFVLIDGQCQPVVNCGCTHEGRYLALGQSFWADEKCQKRCTCNANTRKVECKAVGCKAGTLCQVLKGIKDCHPISHGKCRATGDPHYVTFDKKKFDFMGTCVYQMVKHSMGTDLVPFEVLVQNDHRGSKVVSYTKLVEVKVYSLSVVISRTYQGVVMVDGELANLPLSLAGNRVSVYKSGRYAVVSTNFGLRVFFDWERALFVSLPSSYMGQVSGLCGNYNGKAEDDLTPKDGKVIVPQAQFGASWQVEKIPGCVDSCQGKCPSCDITQKRRYETGTFCGILTDPKGPFRDCHSKVNPADYFEDCVFDVCSFEGRKNVLCQAITSYSSACQAVGAKVYSWRTSQFCEIKCPANSRYETCAAVCPATCQTNLAALGCDEPCREGCVCEEGFVLSGERCVPVSQCGCVDGDRYYTLNQVFYPNGKCDKECKCTADGEVECKIFACGANEKCQVQKGKRQCQAVGVGICQCSGDLHYRSFDGRVFNLQGTCTYTLSKTNLMKGTRLVAFAVRVENDNQKMSVTKGVSLDVYGFNLVLRNTVSGVLVNGILHYLPLSLNNGAVNVYQKGVHYFMATDFGLLLTYDLNYFLTLTVPGNYKGQTSGLCGNFNDNPKDDFQQPDSALTEDLNVFTGSWEVKVPGVKCERGCNGHNCMANDKTDKCPDAMSSQGCLPMMDGNAFKQCRAKVDPKVYYDNCVADSCASKGDRKVVCDSMAAYALRCHLAGINVNWRTDHLCPMKCPANSHYEVCSNNCGVACPGLTDVVECPSSCIEGCTCNDGFLFNGQSCVPMAQCGCYENGRTFRPNEAVYGDGCKQSCRCDAVNGLVCKAHSCSADSQCQVNEGVRACFQKVKQQKKLESNQDPCASKTCSPQEKCVVKDGKAVCVPPPTATCWAWGEPHHHTFDGYNYEFESACRYIYSRTCGNLEGLAAFTINERNGDRESDDAANVKEFIVTVHGFKITASKNKSSEVKVNQELVRVPIVLGNGQVKITYKSGSPLIVTDFGLQVWFELDWKVVVVLPRTYEGKVCGLCGNFNGKRNDELQTPAGQAVSTVDEWGSSWRTDESEDDPCWLD